MHKSLFIVWLYFISVEVCAVSWPLQAQQNIVGELQTTTVMPDDTLPKIARTHGFGFAEIKLLNSLLDTWLPEVGSEVILPAHFILPDAPRTGIVLNIPEMRLYYYPADGSEVLTYPIGIGRYGWGTPYVKTSIVTKHKKPSWYPPESIRAEHADLGDPLPLVVPPGPDNPLGDYALRLALPGYLIHGTNKPYGIGMRVSHGCIRLYPEHIEELFKKVGLETTVDIINQPYKFGLHGDNIYLEAHPYLAEDDNIYQNNLSEIMRWLVEHAAGRRYEINWPKAYAAIANPLGIPLVIGTLLPADPEQ